MNELEHYIRSGGDDMDEILHTWRNLEPYRMLVPTRCDQQIVDLFISNIKVALSVVESDQPGDIGSTIRIQPPSPDQPPGRINGQSPSCAWRQRVRDENKLVTLQFAPTACVAIA